MDDSQECSDDATPAAELRTKEPEDSHSESHSSSSSQCDFLLKKARYPWQVKNKQTIPKTTDLLATSQLHKRKNTPEPHHSGKLRKKSIHQPVDLNFASKLACSTSSSAKEPMRKPEVPNKKPNVELQHGWSLSRGSPLGILLKGVDDVVGFADRHINNSTNLQPLQLKGIMRGITDNSINKILEATGVAPGKRSKKSFNVNQEDLEDEAVSEVIRQQGICAASCSKLNGHHPSAKTSSSGQVSKSRQPTTEIFNPSTSSDVNISFVPETSNASGMLPDDIIDVAVFSAISDKGLNILPA